MLPQLAGVADECVVTPGPAVRVAGVGGGGVEVGVERHLRVDHHLPAAHEVHHEVGPQCAVGDP